MHTHTYHMYIMCYTVRQANRFTNRSRSPERAGNATNETIGPSGQWGLRLQPMVVVTCPNVLVETPIQGNSDTPNQERPRIPKSF